MLLIYVENLKLKKDKRVFGIILKYDICKNLKKKIELYFMDLK